MKIRARWREPKWETIERKSLVWIHGHFVNSMSLSSWGHLNAVGKAWSRAQTFSNTGASHYTGKQVSVVPLLTCGAFLTLQPVTQWKGLNNVFVCRGSDDFTKRKHFLSQSLILCEIRHIISFLYELLTYTLHKAVKHRADTFSWVIF